MTGGDNGKRALINLSSSSSDDDDFSDDDSNIAISSSSDDDRQSIDNDEEFRCSDEEEENDDEEDDNCDDSGDDELTNKVIRFLHEKCDLKALSLNALKSYLRRHGLRVSGNKDLCIERVLEHWRIKDGNAEAVYPRLSFNINCKEQVMSAGETLSSSHKRFMEVTRNGRLLGKRTIAGRVVKESYGAAKQQHTFTVEVLWSKGVKKLPLLFPLLVKGRNLYRLNTYRQPCKNEGERRQVLDEKHRRGTAARVKRDSRNKARSSGRGLKSQMSCSKGGKGLGKEQGASSSKYSTTNSNTQQNTLKQGSKKYTAKPKLSKPFKKPQHTTLRTHHTASRKNSKQSARFQHGMHFEPVIADLQHGYPYHGSMPMVTPLPQHNASYQNSRYIHPSRIVHGNYLNHLPSGIGIEQQRYASYQNSGCIHPPRVAHGNYLNHLPSGIGVGQQRYGLLRCSVQGCMDPGSDRRVIGACWRCCRREGMRCNDHR